MGRGRKLRGEGRGNLKEPLDPISFRFQDGKDLWRPNGDQFAGWCQWPKDSGKGEEAGRAPGQRCSTWEIGRDLNVLGFLNP